MLFAFDWTQLAQQTVIGLSSGGTWALLALAIVLIYRSTGVINFAQGEMAMFSVFIAWSLVHHGLTYWAAFFLTIAISIAGAIAVERVVIRPVEQAPVLTVVIVTLGLLFVVDGAARWFWSPETRTLPNAFSTSPITIGGVAFSWQDLGNIAVSLGLVVLLWGLFRFTKLGLALRAAAVNPDVTYAVVERDGLTVLVVEQNANLALDSSSRAYVLEAGRVALEGTSAELRRNESVRRSYLGY